MAQQEQTEPCNTKLTALSPVGHEANEAYRRVAALALPGLFQQEQVKPGNANLTAPYSVGANGVANLELLGLSQQEQTEPCNTNHTTSCPVGHEANEAYRRVAAFGDTGIRLLQFLVEFHPGGVSLVRPSQS